MSWCHVFNLSFGHWSFMVLRRTGVQFSTLAREVLNLVGFRLLVKKEPIHGSDSFANIILLVSGVYRP